MRAQNVIYTQVNVLLCLKRFCNCLLPRVLLCWNPDAGSGDIVVGGETRAGYVLSALVPPRRTLLVSCNVVAISTKAVRSVGQNCRLILTNPKTFGTSVPDQAAVD